MRSAIARSIAIFTIVVVASWVTTWLIARLLPANRTSLPASLLIVATASLEIGGPIVGLFLAISHFWRNGQPRSGLRPDPTIANRVRIRNRATIFVAIGIPIGVMLIVFFGGMVIPAAWLAGGGDMPPGHGNPSGMQVGRAIFFVSIAMAAVGAILLATSLIIVIGLLLTRRR